MKMQVALFSILTLVSSLSFAQGVPNTFVAGQPARAAEVNENFTSLNDGISTNADAISENTTDIVNNESNIAGLVSRIGTVESSTRPSSDYSGFSLPFSAAGQPRNVNLLRKNNTDGSTTYSIRVRYENSDGESVLVEGVEQTYDYLSVFGSVITDSSGEITSVSKFIEAMDDTSYTHYFRNTIRYLLPELTPTVSEFTEERKQSFSGEGAIRSIVRRTTTYLPEGDGIEETSQLRLRIYTLQDGYEANGLVFNTPARVEYRTVGSSRIRVKGIGVVEYLSGSAPYQIIYYNVDGQTGGSLSGTPFEEGSAIHSLFLN